jgi:hypothetical protein
MQIIGPIAAILMILAFAVLSIASIVRFVKLRYFLKRFFNDGTLSPVKYAQLHTSFYFLFESSPDFLEYRELYEDPKFLAFVNRWRWQRNFLLWTGIGLFIFIMSSSMFD